MPLNPVEIRFEENSSVKKDLCALLHKRFWHSVKSRSAQVDGKYRRWTDNYNGKPFQQVRTTPFYKASNFVPQLIRMHTDILSARLVGLAFGVKPFWKPTTFMGEEPHEVIDALAQWMQTICFNDMDFYRPIDMTIFTTVKTGTTVLKGYWYEKELIKVQAAMGENAQREQAKKRERCQVDPILFDDFFPYPVTATDLSKCTYKFHRLRFTEEEVKYRSNIGMWNEAACKRLLEGRTREQGAAREASAAQAGIELTVDVSRPHTIVEAWFEYELSPGKLYPLMVQFNPNDETENSYLRGFYNYYPDVDMDPFIDFRFAPREDLFMGYSVPEILEQSQEEQAQIHCSRRDGNLIANIPAWKKKRFSDVANPSDEWYPGKVFEVNDIDDLQPLSFGTNYNSLVEEESFLMQLAERYTGISPAMQGFGSGSMGKRGIYNSQGTLALLAEGNKRIDIYLKRMRDPFHRLGRLIHTSYATFHSDGPEYQIWGNNGKLIKSTFGDKRLFYELGASDASANREVDRTALLLMSNTMSAYYKQLVEATQMLAQTKPESPVYNLLLAVCEGARDLANRLLFVFDVPDRNRLAIDVKKFLGGGGTQPGRSPTADQAGMPSSEEPVSVDGIRDLSSNLAALAGSGGPGFGRVQNNGGPV